MAVTGDQRGTTSDAGLAAPAAPAGRPERSSATSVAAQLAFIAVAALAVFGFVQAAQTDQRRTSCSALCALGPQYAARNRTAPDFELADMHGKKVRLSDYRGKTVILNFWTKTCGPCKEEIPALAELAATLKKHPGIELLTVSTDEGPDAVRDTLKVLLDQSQATDAVKASGDAPFTILFDPELEVVRGKYGTSLFPETWIIDPRGVIRARFDRALDWSSALAIEVAEMANTPGPGCLVEFDRGKATGPFAGLCEND
jgi:peroxiredoxin